MTCLKIGKVEAAAVYNPKNDSTSCSEGYTFCKIYFMLNFFLRELIKLTSNSQSVKLGTYSEHGLKKKISLEG